jgi:hypothetical protein
MKSAIEVRVAYVYRAALMAVFLVAGFLWLAPRQVKDTGCDVQFEGRAAASGCPIQRPARRRSAGGHSRIRSLAHSQILAGQRAIGDRQTFFASLKQPMRT